METEVFGKAVLRFFEFVGTGKVKNAVLMYEPKRQIYFIFDECEADYQVFIAENIEAEVILSLDYYKAKVLIRMIKDIDEEMKNYGDYQKNSQDREQSGNHDTGLDVGDAERKNGGADNTSELSGSNDNGNNSDSGSDK